MTFYKKEYYPALREGSGSVTNLLITVLASDHKVCDMIPFPVDVFGCEQKKGTGTDRFKAFNKSALGNTK